MESIDTEWSEAQSKDEAPQYYKCEMRNDGSCVKLYKPSIAELVRVRTGLCVENKYHK